MNPNIQGLTEARTRSSVATTGVSARESTLLPNGQPRYVRVYDNRGKTADRYTVVFTGRRRGPQCDYVQTPRGIMHVSRQVIWTTVLGMDETPFSPQGIGMISSFSDMPDRPRSSHLGTRLAFADLPKDCQRLTLRVYRDLWDLQTAQES